MLGREMVWYHGREYDMGAVTLSKSQRQARFEGSPFCKKKSTANASTIRSTN